MITWISVQNLIGGMALGFEKEFGYPKAIVTNGVENDKLYINYCKQRGLDIPVYLMNADYTEIIDGPTDKLPDVDMYVMTPICSGLSMLNTCKIGDKRRGCADNCQNQNMYNLTSLALRNNVKVAVFENAPALYTKSGSDVADKLHQIANDFNYSFGLFATNTLFHGIPQSRKRTFAMFYRDTNPALFNFERKQIKDFCTYLDEIPQEAEYQNVIFENLNDDIYLNFILDFTHKKTMGEVLKFLNLDLKCATARRIIEILGYEHFVKWCDKKLAKITDENKIKTLQKCKKYINHCINKKSIEKGVFDSTPMFYLDGHTNAIIAKNFLIYNYNHNRFCSLRELMYLMGLPHDFKINVSRDVPKITQNVPVCTSNFIARQLKSYFENKLPIANSKFVKQNNHNMKNEIF